MFHPSKTWNQGFAKSWYPMVPQPGRFQHPRPISTLHSSVTTSLFTQLRHPERPKVPGKWCHIGVTCSCYSSLWVAGTRRLDCGHFASMTSHWVIKDIYRLYMIILYCSMSQQGLVWAFAVRSNTKLCVFHLMVSPLQACMSLVSLIHWFTQDALEKKHISTFESFE